MIRQTDIVYVIPRPEIGGAEKQLLRLIEHVDRERYRITVICLDGRGSLLAAFEEAADEVIVLERRGLFDLITFTRLLAHLRRIKPSTVHTTLYIANLFGGWAARLAGVPRIVVAQRGLGIDPRHSRLKRILHALFNHFIAQFSDVRVVNSRAVADRMSTYGWEDCRVIYNGVIDRSMASEEIIEALRIELEIPSNGSVLVAVSRIDPKKDLMTMLRAFREVTQRVSCTYLVIAGDGFPDYREQLIAEAHRLDIIDRVRFLGFRDDVADLIALSDVSLLSSVTEGLPNAVLESMLLARPVVATAVGGVPELIEDGIEGYLVASGDTRALADRVVELLENPVRREAMGIFGRARALSDFGIQTTVAKTTETYGDAPIQVRRHHALEIPVTSAAIDWHEATTTRKWARSA